MLNFILDRAADFNALSCATREDAKVIAISAEAMTGIPPDFPASRITPLSSLISAQALASEVMLRVSHLWPTLAGYRNCPYYKVKQFLDAVIEKQIIVEQLARLPGEKKFVSDPRQWVSADGDNHESCRFAALFMDTLPDFTAVAGKPLSIGRERLMRILRLLRRTAIAARNRSVFGRNRGALPVIGAAGYGAAGDFANTPHQKIDIGSVILAAILRGHWRDAAFLLTHDAPITIDPPQAEKRHFYLTLCRKVIDRANRTQRAIDRLPHRPGSLPRYYFTVNYGRLGDIAIVRALRAQGVPCITMQHACVGHDTWTASQYLDLWETDAKLVANRAVATSLASFEEPRAGGVYLPVSLPMYRKRASGEGWDGKSLLYVLTGFTRANTMYDNRRINDALYLEQILHDLGRVPPKFDTRIRPHPYDTRQYRDAIAQHLCSRLGCQIAAGKDTVFAAQALVIIDSPSTILADMVLSGRPVLLINRTAKLMPAFLDLARQHYIIFPGMLELIDHLKTTPADLLMQQQRAFAKCFIALYCQPTDDLSIPASIERHLAQDSAPQQKKNGHPRCAL